VKERERRNNVLVVNVAVVVCAGSSGDKSACNEERERRTNVLAVVVVVVVAMVVPVFAGPSREVEAQGKGRRLCMVVIRDCIGGDERHDNGGVSRVGMLAMS
jgi:hypothetical protein